MITNVVHIFATLGITMLLCIPQASAEQTHRLPRIGVLWSGVVDHWNKAFLDGLREKNYVADSTAVIQIRATAGKPELGPRLASELVALEPDVLFAVPGILAKHVVNAQKAAGKQIPIVVATQDPLSEGLVDNVAHPGGNITGIAGVMAPGELMTKHLQLLKELLPRLKRVGCLIDTSWKEFSLQTKVALESAGPKLGIQVNAIEVRDPNDLERALSEALRKRVEAMIIPVSPMLLGVRSRIIEFASKHRLPAAYGEEVFAYEGGLVSYGFSVADTYSRAAGVVVKILQGAKPADIPVDYAMRFRLVLNKRTARSLKLPIPATVVMQANEVIE